MITPTGFVVDKTISTMDVMVWCLAILGSGCNMDEGESPDTEIQRLVTELEYDTFSESQQEITRLIKRRKD